MAVSAIDGAAEALYFDRYHHTVADVILDGFPGDCRHFVEDFSQVFDIDSVVDRAFDVV